MPVKIKHGVVVNVFPGDTVIIPCSEGVCRFKSYRRHLSVLYLLELAPNFVGDAWLNIDGYI